MNFKIIYQIEIFFSKTAFVFLLLWLLSGCTAKQIIRDSEYRYSLAAAKSGNVERALEEFPKKENGGYVTSLEKSWLMFWNNKNSSALTQAEADYQLKYDLSLNNLLHQSATLDARKYLSASREAEYFFFQESEDGYVPAEHEVIIMHLLTAQYFILQKNWTKAEVEVRRATFFLQSFFPEGQSHFDDTSLRVWLGALWASLGYWNEAQVDFRKAYELSGDKRYLQISQLAEAPALLELKFYSLGPELSWLDSSYEPKFIKNTHYLAQIQYENPNEIIQSTYPWYERHKQRNSVIRDVLVRSNYMSQFVGIKTASLAKSSAGHTVTGTYKVLSFSILGLAVAGGLELASAGAGSSAMEAYVKYVGGAAVMLSTWVWAESEKLSDEIQKSIRGEERLSLEDLRTYRLVRFLPEAIGLNYNLKDSGQMGFYIQAPNSKTKVFLKHSLF